MNFNIPKDAPIFVAGHRGLVGSAIVRRLEEEGFTRVLTATRHEMDLRNQQQVNDWFASERPQFVFHAAGTVGGIHANATRPAEFLYDNLMMHANVIHAAWKNDVQRLLYLGSSCIYPRDCPQPIREEYLLTGPLESTNDAYAIAKISGIKMCQSFRRQYGCDYISAMPTNLYGPQDNFDLTSSHVLPALIRKFHEAKRAGRQEVEVWGSGRPMREFLHVDDLADACLFLMRHYNDESHINVGTGTDVTIRELAETIAKIVHPTAELKWDASKPDGTPRKLMDSSRIHDLGWKHKIDLEPGIRSTYQWYLDHVDHINESGRMASTR